MELKSTTLLLYLFLSITPGICQKLITAKVVDLETNSPIDQAEIIKVSDSIKTSTNHLGYFQITIDSSDYLIIAKEGYKTSKIKPPLANSFLIQIEKEAEINAVEVVNEYEKGQLVDGYKTGIWEYYDDPDEVALRIDYSKGKLLFIKEDTADYAIQMGDEYILRKVDQQARYLGSMKEFYSIIQYNAKYPRLAGKKSVIGAFHIIFEVDTTGQAKNFMAINDIGYGCGDEVIRSLKLVPNMWLPAKLNGKAYTTRFVLPVNFKIIKDGREVGRQKKSVKEPVPIAHSLSEIGISMVGIKVIN